MPARAWKVKPVLVGGRGRVVVGPSADDDGDGIMFGTLGEAVTGRPPSVWLGTAKEQVIAVVGKRGSGKSFSLGVIAEGLAVVQEESVIGLQRRRRAVLLFDPLDVYWTTRFPVTSSSNVEAERLHRLASDAGLAGLTFNVLAWVPGSSSRRESDPTWFRTLQLPVASLGLDEWELLLNVRILTEPMGQAFADALTLVRSTGYVRDGEQVPAMQSFGLPDVEDATHSDAMEAAYNRETLRALRQRITSLQATGLFHAVGTPMTDLLSPGQLSVVLLERLPDSYRSAVVGVVTRMLMDERGRTAFAEKRLALDPDLNQNDAESLRALIHEGVPRTVVILDEAQSFLAPGLATPARDLFVRLVKEGRNIGLSAVIATQQPSAVDQRVLSQVETFVAHQLVTEPDIRAVRENLKSRLPDDMSYGQQKYDFSSLLRELSPGQCLVSAADITINPRRSIIVDVRARATVHGGIEL